MQANIHFALTAMNNRVCMTVFESRADLSSELASASLSQAAMRDNVVQHLASVDVLEDHVIVIRIDKH